MDHFQRSRNRDVFFLTYVVNLAEQLIGTGREKAAIVRKMTFGRTTISSVNLINVRDHLPCVSKTRRRCR